MITAKKITISWILLLVLTCLSVLIGLVIDNQVLFVFIALLIVFLKGQQIIDVFMELKYAPTNWRLIILSYVIIIPSVIFLIYLL